MLGYTIDELKQTRVYREAKDEGRQEGEQLGAQREAAALILRQITHRFGTLPTSAVTHIEQLPIEQLETLSVACLDFRSLTDLETWLAQL
jgi:predicted transposase YdaD